jgi:hypothetical protein
VTEQTETIETRFGSVEIETYECDSCGVEVAKEDTVPFEIGSREGRACQTCEESGPISFPKRAIEPMKTLANTDLDSALISIMFGPVFLPAAVMIYLDKRGAFEAGIVIATITCLLWLGIPLLLVL